MISGMTTVDQSVFSSAAPSRSLLRNVDLTGPAGRLEALLNEGASNAPFAALLCHPHPLGGGTMNNKVVYHAMKAVNDPAWGLAWPVLRFNFRGVGLSQGVHHGEAEVGDVLAALDWLENQYRLPIVLIGFSFGAAMALHACCASSQSPSRIRALVSLGLPLRAEDHIYQYSFHAGCSIPKFFLSGDRDLFAPAEELSQLTASIPEPKLLQLIPNADHFFTDQLEAMQLALSGWLKEQLS